MQGYLDSASHFGISYIKLALLNILNQQGIPTSHLAGVSCLTHTRSLARLESLEVTYLLRVSLASALPQACRAFFFLIFYSDF
jgi:hypothetical protein